MKNPRLYRGGHGPLLRIIGGLIGVITVVVVHTVVVYTAADHITEGLCALLIKSRDRGVEQADTRMRVPH